MPKDLIGREEVVEKISALINNLGTNQHFCLALDGEWGSGKTFVMELLKERLATNKEYFVVTYDAWENSFYSDPLIAILYCILDGVQENFYYTRGIKEYGKAAKQVVKSIGGTVTNIAKATEPTGKLGKIFTVISSVVKGIQESIKALKFDKTDDIQLQGFKSYKTLLNEVKASLNKLTEAEIYSGKQTKLVILVDEIDRCLPDEQMKVLERLHHLLDVKNCFVVCSINKKTMGQCFKHCFDNDGNEYFKKFFDKEIFLNSDSQKFFSGILAKKIDEYAEFDNMPISNEQKEQLVTTIDSLMRRCHLENMTDNRELERVWDGFWDIASNTDEIENFAQLCVIAILVFLKKYVNEKYRSDVFKRAKYGGYFVDFISEYFRGTNVPTTGAYLQGDYQCNRYVCSFLNYYNCVLNYYHFGEHAGYVCQAFFHIAKDNFIENFANIIKNVEIYSK